MGYKAKRKIYRLKFGPPDYPELAGLEVVMKSLSTGDLLKVGRGSVRLGEDEDGTDSVKRAEEVTQMFSIMARSLVSWNLEDDDGPVPATLDGLMDQDLDLVLPLIQAWTGAMASVPPPSLPASNGGGRFPEVSLPMEALSPNPSS